MEERGALLKGIARVLNAGGSALLNIYDAATSIKISSLSGEKQKLKGNVRAYEKKIERLYYEIGKEVSGQGDTTRISAAGEAGVKLVAEYRAEIEIIKQRVEEIEAAERIERQRLLEEREAARKTKRQEAEKQVKVASEKAAPRREVEREVKEETYAAQTEPVIIAEPSLPEAGEISAGVAMEEENEPVTEAAETPEYEFQKETAELAASAVIPADVGIQKRDWMPRDPQAGAPVRHDAQYPVAEATGTEAQEIGTGTIASAELEASEVATGAETEQEKGAVAEVSEIEKEELHEYTTEDLQNMLKVDLLALCTEKGIEVDRRMTKAQIIELILARL